MINSSPIQYSNAHLHYVHNKYARFQKDPLKPVGRVDYTICNRQTDRQMDRQGQILMPPTIITGAYKKKKEYRLPIQLKRNYFYLSISPIKSIPL